jgi:hypothetical protein
MRNAIKTKDAKKGGYLVGKPHSEGGIKGINTDTGEPIEVEGGEVVITKPAVDSGKKYSFEGKEMTPKEILSKLNSDHGGVAFKDGGEIPNHKFGGGGLFLGGAEDEQAFNDYYTGRDYIPNVGDDFGTEIRTCVGIQLFGTLGNIVIRNSNGHHNINESVFIGSFLFVKPYRNIDDDIKLFGKHYYDEVIQKYGYNFYVPFQVKRFNRQPSNNQDLKSILLGRIIDGQYNEFELDVTYGRADRVVLMPNPLVELPADFSSSQDIIYPQNIPNLINYANRIGNVGLIFFDINSGAELITYNVIIASYPINNGISMVTEEISDGNERIKPLENMLFINDTANIRFQDRDRFQEVTDYAVDNNNYYTYNTVPNVIYTLDQLTNNQELEIKLLGIQTDGEYYAYQSIIFEHKGKIYANYKGIQTEKYGYDLRLMRKIAIGEPENRFVNETLSELEKSIRKVKSKQQTNKPLYERLLKITDAEISKFSTFRGLIDNTNIPRRNELDRKLAQLQDDRDMFALKLDTGLELLDKFADLENQEKEDMGSGLTTNLAINGQPSELTDRQWHKVRTPNFLSWFGNWEKAYEVSNYGNVSKAINERTAEPIVLYHGSRADFVKWRFNQFPAAYFADNRSYSQWFANLYGGGTLYQVFVDIKNPIDVRIFGTEQRPLREYLDYLQVNYQIDYYDAYPKIKEYEAGGQQAVDELLDTPLRFWEFIRHWNSDFLIYLRDMTFFDGIIMYENNPSDQVNGQDNVTGSYVVFKNDQIKWATANHFIGKVNDARFALGGRIEEDNQRFLLKNMDFVI